MANNLELALRVRADVSQAVSQLHNLQSQITGTGQTTTTAQRTASQATDQTTQAVERQSQALEQASNSLDLSQEIRQTERLGQAMDDTAQATQNTVNINERMEQSLRALTPHFMALIGLSGGLLSASMNALEKSAELRNLSNLSGMNVEQFQYFAVGAKSVGIEMDKLSDIFKDTRDKVGDFLATGGGELQDFFENIAPQVGVTAEQFRHLSGADALQLYVNSLREANVSENEMIFYMESIADEASALLPLLNEGGEGFRKYGEQAKQAGAILGQDTVNDALKAKSAISEFHKEMQGIGNQMLTHAIPAIKFVAEHLHALTQAGLIVASMFAGRMVASLVATTSAFITGQVQALQYQMALARMADVSAITATRMTALATASRLLTASGGFLGLGVAVAGMIASFLLMRKSTDQATESLDSHRKSVHELKGEYDKLSESQKRVREQQQISQIQNLTDAYHKQAQALRALLVEAYANAQASSEQRKRISELNEDYRHGRISSEQLANEMNKMSSVSQELKNKIDQQAGSTATAKSQMDEANHVLAVYQGKAQLATSASAGLANGIDGVANSAEHAKNQVASLSKEYQQLMARTKQDTVRLNAINQMIKQGYSPERATAYVEARLAKGSNLDNEDAKAIEANLKAKEQHQKLTEKASSSGSRSGKSSSRNTTRRTNSNRSSNANDERMIVGVVGNTGIGTGAHLDIRRADGKEPTASDLDRFRAGGKKLTAYKITSGYGQRTAPTAGASSFHKGIDFAIGKGTEITTNVPVKDVKLSQSEKGGWISTVTFQDGLVMNLLHQDPSVQSKVGTRTGRTSTVSTSKQQPKYQYLPEELTALKRVQGLIYGGSGLDKLAEQHGVPAHLLAGLMMQESKGIKNAVSPEGALGYFQTTSIFRKQWNMKRADSFDLKKSGAIAIKALASAYKEFGNWEDAIRSYNAGIGGAKQFKRTGRVSGDKARNQEVREYVPKIARWSAWFGSDEFYQANDEKIAQQHLKFVQAEADLEKQRQEAEQRQAEKRAELLYQFASEPDKAKIDYEKKVAEIKSAGFDEQEQNRLLQQAEKDYQDKLTKRPEILQRALDSVKMLEQDFMQSTKTEHENNLYQIEHKYDDLLNDIKTLRELAIDPQQQKDLDDAEHKIRIIIDKEKLKAEYEHAMSELDKMQAEKQQKIDILQQHYDSSNMTAHEFHTQKTAIDEDFNPRLKDMATNAQHLAHQLNDAFSVEKLNLFIAGLSQAQTSFQQFLPTAEQLNDRITNGLTDAFFAFADGTKSAEQAFREFASAFFREIAQMILKQMIFNAISNAGKSGGGGWGGAIAGVIGSAFGGKGYSSGGYTGKGGKYEPAGIVHRDEFVIRKEMTNQVGAKEFLANFNRYGMTALKGLQGYSSGGLVGASVPNISAPQVQAPKLSSPSEKIAQSTSLNNQQNFYLVDDPSRILDTLNSSQGQENLVVMMSRDPEKFKTALKIG